MCGRFGFNLTKRDLEDGFGVRVEGAGPGADYNISPDPTGQRPVLAILLEHGQRNAERVLCGMAWGLVPAWSDDPRRYFINARAETALEKPSFRHALRHRRCLVPAGLYYEWKNGPKGEAKAPHVFTLENGAPFALAAIWEHNEVAGTGLALLTTAANSLVAPVHERMPVILRREHHAAWLDPDTPEAALPALLRPNPAAGMRCWAVSRRVNNPAAHGPELIEPLPTLL